MAGLVAFKYDDPSTPYNPAASGQVGSASAPPPTATPPAAPAAQIQTFAGYTPDYAGLIKSDPAYLAAQTNAQQAQTAAAAQRRAALRTALIRYGGGLPSNFTDQYGDVDQATLDQAGQNQQSTLANLAQNYGQSEQQFLRQLAARLSLQRHYDDRLVKHVPACPLTALARSSLSPARSSRFPAEGLSEPHAPDPPRKGRVSALVRLGCPPSRRTRARAEIAILCHSSVATHERQRRETEKPAL